MSALPIATKFVSWDVSPLEILQNNLVYKLREKLNGNSKMNREEKNWLAEKMLNNIHFRTVVPLMGYRFDFSDVLRKFLVNQYGRWDEYYAPDKTSLRSVLYGRINQIVELK